MVHGVGAVGRVRHQDIVLGNAVVTDGLVEVDVFIVYLDPTMVERVFAADEQMRMPSSPMPAWCGKDLSWFGKFTVSKPRRLRCARMDPAQK